MSDRVTELHNEAKGLIGMLAEARSKCLLMKSRVKTKRKVRQGPLTDDDYKFGDGIIDAVERIRNDIHTYSIRLKEIYQELEEINAVY